MSKVRKYRRDPFVEMFGGSSKRWIKKAHEAGLSHDATTHIIMGMFKSILPEDQVILESVSGKTMTELVAAYKLWLLEREEVRKERRQKRRQRSRELYGHGEYPSDDEA